MNKNDFCSRSDFSNEASVETWFVDPLLRILGFGPEDVNLKTSLSEYKIGKGSKSLWYKPDYVVLANRFPTLIIDAKNPTENIADWTQQCASYCLEINRSFEHQPVEYFVLTNGLSLSLFRWDKGNPIISMDFDDFVVGNPKYEELNAIVNKTSLTELASEKETALLDEHFKLQPATQHEIEGLFAKLHRFIWTTENLNPSAAFAELMKIVFVKIKKDRELHERFDIDKLKVRDVVFSVAWIKSQTEHENPINDPLFKNLIKDLEKEIQINRKRRIFDASEDIKLAHSTIEKIVADLEHVDLFSTDEDVHGRMFEIFLAATIRGKELGQFFTPRDIVRLMVGLADVQVTKTKVETVIDPCCGSGGFLIMVLRDMWDKVERLVGVSNIEVDRLKAKIADEALCGIDAGNNPPMWRIARMNMYLHGDGGSNVFFADSLDKAIGQVGPSSIEIEREVEDLRNMVVRQEKRFDVVLANPPFSMSYSRKDDKQRRILDQYDVATNVTQASSLLSSVMYLERYKDLAQKDGRILAVIDESILSSSKFKNIREFIRRQFVIRGVVSLPGDAFKHAAARVKTSILILRPKKPGEEQTPAFMDKAVYLGLTEKSLKRLGIAKDEFERGRKAETDRIIEAYRKFELGQSTVGVVGPDQLADRLDVKHCIGDRGRKRNAWQDLGVKITCLNDVLSVPSGRTVTVQENDSYDLLKVTYSGDVLEGDTLDGADTSYKKLSRVEAWDVVYSDMGVGRGAIGIVPSYLAGHFVSTEYTILTAKSPEEALYYTSIMRSKEILGDILTMTTGLNRGRVSWKLVAEINVPEYDQTAHDMAHLGVMMTNLWEVKNDFDSTLRNEESNIASTFSLEDESARLRWLGYKPPE